MQKKLGTLILILLCSMLFISEAHAEAVSYLSEISTDILDRTRLFTLNLYAGIAAAYKGIYTTLSTIVLSLVIYFYSISKIGLDTVASFFIALIVSATVAMHVDIFESVIYTPFFDTLYKLCAYIPQIAGAKLGSGLAEVKGINGIIDIAHKSVESFSQIMDKIIDEVDFGVSNILSSIMIIITVIIIKGMFIFLLSYFVVKITIAIFSTHMMMVFMPITLSLFPFKSLRPYSFLAFKNIFHYALVALFCCIAMAITIFLINDLVVKITQEDSLSEIKFGYLTVSIVTSLFGFILIHSSSEFASRILNTVGGGIMSTNSKLQTQVVKVMSGAGIVTAGASVMQNRINSTIFNQRILASSKKSSFGKILTKYIK